MRLLRKLLVLFAERAHTARLYWHNHQTFGFLLKSLTNLIEDLVESEVAYLTLFATIRDMAKAVREPIALHSKPKPKKKKELNKRKAKLQQMEGAVYNWRFMLREKIID